MAEKKNDMKILLVGGGGREHAIADAIIRSPRTAKLYCAPGNAGIAGIAECVPIGTMDFPALISFAKEKEIDLTVCSMDDPLCAGIVDAFEAEGLRIFGTPANAAIIEGSKAFSKDLMKKYDIPTAAYETFDDAEKALAYLENASFPIVLKASGLALGKGVLICEDLSSARDGIRELMTDKKFGDAGSKVVIEEFMTGGDTGLNTGGMGTFSPSPFYTKEIDAWCRENIYDRTVAAMAAEGRPFRGVLYFGLMLTPAGPRVLEFNTRFGDPETQVVLPRMKTDIIDVMEACIDGTLDKISLEFADNAAVCVVIASGGYPEAYEKGKVITGLDKFEGKTLYRCYHAGTSFDADRNIVTSGGRVLGVVAIGDTLKEARANAYEAAGWVHFDKMYMRSDIGKAIDAV